MIARKKKTTSRPAEKAAEKTKTRQPLPKSGPEKRSPVVNGIKPLTVELPIASIDAQPFNPRTAFDQAELESLATSLRDNGLLQPIIVRTGKPGRYQLIAGGRRLKAAAIAGWKTVPATVRNATDEDAITWALIENLDRADLNPVEVARGVNRLCAPKENGGCGMTLVAAGETMGRDTSWIRRQIQLLRLPEVWLARIAIGEISVGMGAVLIKFADRPSVLAKIEDDMITNPWSWRTIGDFELNANLLANEGEGGKRPAVAAELQPMRARPGDTEDPDNIRRRKYPKGAASSTSVADDADAGGGQSAEHAGDDVTAADPPTPRPTLAADHADGDVEDVAGRQSGRGVVSQIVELVSMIDDITDLNEVTAAIDRRRRELMSANN